ncbi:hypothetical protein FKM82_000417 [Ascaphus truei]
MTVFEHLDMEDIVPTIQCFCPTTCHLDPGPICVVRGRVVEISPVFDSINPHFKSLQPHQNFIFRES